MYWSVSAPPLWYLVISIRDTENTSSRSIIIWAHAVFSCLDLSVLFSGDRQRKPELVLHYPRRLRLDADHGCSLCLCGEKGVRQRVLTSTWGHGGHRLTRVTCCFMEPAFSLPIRFKSSRVTFGCSRDISSTPEVVPSLTGQEVMNYTFESFLSVLHLDFYSNILSLFSHELLSCTQVKKYLAPLHHFTALHMKHSLK